MAKIKNYELFINDKYVSGNCNISVNKYNTGDFEFTVFPHNTCFKEVVTGEKIKIEIKEDAESIFVKNVEIIDGSCEINDNSYQYNKNYRIYFKVLEDLIKDEKYYYFDYACFDYKEVYLMNGI